MRLVSALAAAASLVGCDAFAADEIRTQSHFDAWTAQADHASQVKAFETYLEAQNAAGILPTYQVLRTASSWQACKVAPYEVAHQAKWPNIVQTLKFVRDEVQPKLGALEARSGYRSRQINTCAGGARTSAHVDFYALDLVPLDPTITRTTLIQRICRVHAEKGSSYRIGLGFYDGVRFHLDAKSFRRWGPNGRAATSPCASVR